MPTPPRQPHLPARHPHVLHGKHPPDDNRLGEPLCPDCYDYTGSVLFNAYAPELWRRFTITLRRKHLQYPPLHAEPLPTRQA